MIPNWLGTHDSVWMVIVYSTVTHKQQLDNFRLRSCYEIASIKEKVGLSTTVDYLLTVNDYYHYGLKMTRFETKFTGNNFEIK